jgi:hypothetical protein
MGLIELFISIIEYFLFFIQWIWSYFAGSIPYLDDFSFNIYLFSETGWFTEPMPFVVLMYLISGIFMFIFLLRLLWKGTKKFINMVFGVFKL